MSPAEMKEWIKEKTNVRGLLPKNVLLVDSLACGAQGVVFKGTVDGKAAAIKIYFPGQVQQRVQREIDALKLLSCPSIVSLLWAGSVCVDSVELPVVATELVHGGGLDAVLSRKPLSHDQLGVLCYDICTAIDAMWTSRIVHRDLKPSNVVLTPAGRAKVIDLGVARHLDQSSLTGMGLTWGTCGYLSPEQARSVRQLTCKSDIFALGVILVEAAKGRHPTHGDQHRLFAQGLHANMPVEITGWQHSNIVSAMLHPRPTSRPRPRDVVASLSEYQP